MAAPYPLEVYSARDLGAHHGAATSVAWSCSAHRLASGGVDGCIKIWAPDRTRPSFNANLQQQNQNQSQNPAAERPVGEIRLPSSASGPKASSSSNAAGGGQSSSRARPPRVNRLAWHPRLPDVLAAASDDGATIRLFDARTGEPCAGGASSISSSSSSSGRRQPSLVASMAPPSPVPRCAAISLAWCPGRGSEKTENLVAVGSDADVISFFDASTGRLLALLPPPAPGVEVNEAVFSSCGTVFARAVGTHGAVELFSVAELLEGKGGGGGSLGGGGGGNPPTTLSASDWKQLRAPARPFAVLRGHTSTVFALSTVSASASSGAGAGEGGGYGGSPLSGPASFLLASGGADGAAVVWDLRRGGSPLATCGAFDHQVKSVSLGGGWRGYGGGGGKESPSGGASCWGAGVGSLIAYAGEGDAVVVEDWTQSAASGSFLPPRDPTTAAAAAAATTRPASYQLRVFVPRVESLALAPAVVWSDGGAPPSSAAAGGAEGDENGNNPPSPRSSSKRSPPQSNVGALAFVRCIPAGGGGAAGLQRGGGGEVIGAVGLFAPPPLPASSKRSAPKRSKSSMPRNGALACRAAGDSKSPGAIDASMADASTSTSASTASVSAEALDRALGYPYARPPSSFVWSWHSDDDGENEHGSVQCFDDRAWAVAFEREGAGGEGPPSAERLAEELRLPLPSARALASALESCVWEEGEDGKKSEMTAVVALGSNAGPSQLARKFPRERFPSAAVPVLRAMLRGHDVCYAPLISSYGSVTATLHEAGEEEEEEEGGGGEGGGEKGREKREKQPATSVEVWVTFLTPELLQRMHETEACYDLQRLDCPGEGKQGRENLLLALGTCADSEALGREPPAAFLRSALCYTHQAGSLLLPVEHVSAARRAHGGERGREGEGEEGDGETPTATTLVAVAVAEVRALNRRLPSLPQRGAQAAVAVALARDHGHEVRAEELAEVEAWVARNLTDEESRRAAVALLVERAARAFSSPVSTKLEQLGSVFGRSVD